MAALFNALLQRRLNALSSANTSLILPERLAQIDLLRNAAANKNFPKYPHKKAPTPLFTAGELKHSSKYETDQRPVCHRSSHVLASLGDQESKLTKVPVFLIFRMAANYRFFGLIL
ncbi:hypothetical protein HJG54_02120 [Leptolyngbya sp. NK1-12]|uniref:Uncharacterized protein n=1 Tax=Leptolyngbya sp. NK1-12 TaxID=2547451 RepID=A0AA97AIE5_9CYAN|nr:hypothetical protein [Leptolyngbya sp. NK1-12]WNZ21782.1 hypothetical protein HJG54_02120 [Leptolyngbya sp. NK1-12]